MVKQRIRHMRGETQGTEPGPSVVLEDMILNFEHI